jgi:CHAT domain-containing protein
MALPHSGPTRRPSRLRPVLAMALAALLCAPAWSQYTEIETSFKRASPGEERNLRDLLAEPAPNNTTYLALRRHFIEKNIAAMRLGDDVAREEVLREAASRLPDAAWKMDLGAILLSRGEIEQGNFARSIAIQKAPGSEMRALYMAFVARDFALQLNDDGARLMLRKMRDLVQNNKIGTNRWTALRMLDQRALAHGAMAESVLEQRASRHDAAIRAAHEAEDHARSAWGLLTSGSDPARTVVGADIGLTISRRLEAQRAARRYEDAERTLNEYVRVSRDFELSPEQQADLYLLASDIRSDKRVFSDALELARKSDAVLAKLGMAETHPARIARARALLGAWVGQRVPEDASKLLDRLDELAGENEALKRRVSLPLERGLVYLATDREVEASTLFERVAADSARIHGSDHFYTAQARGLQGVALWRSDSRASRDEAVPLLRSAMQQMMAPANGDYVERIGLRLDLRDLIAEAYLETVGRVGPEALAALQIADWMATGVVREALEDAAARSAAGNPALVDLVRQDQELRNEVRSMRKYMDGTGGTIDTLLPALAAKTRNRIDALEQQRRELQARIKGRFPDYEQILRPRPAALADVADRLAPDEALVAILPTDRSVYVWAVGAAGPGAFHRERLSRGELNLLVRRVRQTLDFNEMGGKLRAFDRSAAAELYARLLAPLEPMLRDKNHLIIASSGSLGEIPFGVLITGANDANSAPVPWLIHRAALSHEPSVSAWLALRRAPPVAANQEPLMAWGDPTFKRAAAAAPVVVAAAPSATPTDDADLKPRRSAFTRRSVSLSVNLDDTSAALRYAEVPPLPETRDELRAIAGALRANEATDLKLGAAATRESVLAASQSGLLARKRVVAFATHGLMAGDLPQLTQPALALAATGNEGKNPLAPLLTLEDVMSLKLNADWVILSACNTAASDGSASEALSGLARGFFYAGARSVLATHWAVESESARLLTTATFSHYAQQTASRKSESLRQAMIGVMAMPGFEHPAFWAPYALVGDGGR